MGYQDIKWFISVPWGKYISITFLDLDVEGDAVEEECFASLVVSKLSVIIYCNASNVILR